MVLERLGARLWGITLVAALCALSAACVHDRPIRRLSQPQQIAVSIVHDRGSEVAEVPQELIDAIEEPLRARNLVPDYPIPSGEYGNIVESRSRLDLLASKSSSPYVLLIETRAEFFSQMQGRFRWTVYMRMSLMKRDGGATEVSFSLPVVLTYEHEREEAALAHSGGPSARKLARMLDDFLGGAADTVAAPRQSASAPLRSPASRAIYFVLIDRFANGRPDEAGTVDASDPHAYHGGDLRGLTERLDYIRDLGFDSLWITPVFAQRTEKIDGIGAFHGYWTEDLRRVEPRFGTKNDLLALRDGLEARGMGLILDVVLNHVGYDTELTARKSWFHGRGDIVDWNDPEELTQNDVHGLPDLAQENEEVYRYLTESSREWIRVLRPAGLRLDAVKHIAMGFWRRYNRDMARAGPGLELIGEYYDGDPSALARALREGGFTALFDFPLHFAMVDVFCQDAHPGRLASVLSSDRFYDDPERLVTFADNHDLPRVASQCGGDLGRVRQLLRFQLTARGIASMTYGTENGMQGGQEPENRGDMSFEADAPLADDVRALLRWRAEHDLGGAAQAFLAVTDDLLAYARITDRRVQIFAYNRGPTATPLPAPEALAGEIVATIGLEDGAVPAGGAAVAMLRGDFAAERRRLTDPDPVWVRITVSGAPAGELRVAGSGAEFGSWVVDRAPSAPGGRLEIRAPRGAVFAVKPVVVGPGGAETWAPGENRYVVADGQDVALRWN